MFIQACRGSAATTSTIKQDGRHHIEVTGQTSQVDRQDFSNDKQIPLVKFAFNSQPKEMFLFVLCSTEKLIVYY